ncbi:MAG: biopolymer transporter ExbD [Verrucomicrobiota bacterium]
MAKRGFKADPDDQIDMQIAPMVNLMFVLLCAFTVAAGESIIEGHIGVQVPSESKSAKTDKEVLNPPVNIIIAQDGAVFFNKSPIAKSDDIELEGLREKLKRLIDVDQDQSVIIRPDPEAKQQRVIDVLSSCSYAGVRKLSFGS